MTQYFISVWHDDNYGVLDFSDPEVQDRVGRVGQFNEELMAAGAWVFGAGLHPASSATTVRPNGTDVTVTDGPYAESKEQIGGFWVIEAADMDAALEWTRKASLACGENLEIRPLQG